MDTTMTFTFREMTTLRAALTYYEENRRDQSKEAEAEHDNRMVERFDRQAQEARDLYVRVFFACDTEAEERKLKAAA